MKCSDDALRYKLVNDGLSVSEIAKICGTTETAIRSWKTRHNLGPKRQGKWLNEGEVRELFDAGWSDAEMADAFGVDITTIATFRQRHGMLRHRRPPSVDWTDQLTAERQARADNMRSIAADNARAREAGLSYGTFSQLKVTGIVIRPKKVYAVEFTPLVVKI